MKINKISLFLFLFSSITLAQENIKANKTIADNRIGVNLFLNHIFKSGAGCGFRLFYDRSLPYNFSIKPYYQKNFNSIFDSRSYNTLGFDINYSIKILYLGIGPTYNVFGDYIPGDIFLTSYYEGFKFSYRKTTGFDLAAGINTNLAALFSLNLEVKYSYLRPVSVSSWITDDNQEFTFTKKTKIRCFKNEFWFFSKFLNLRLISCFNNFRLLLKRIYIFYYSLCYLA